MDDTPPRRSPRSFRPARMLAVSMRDLLVVTAPLIVVIAIAAWVAVKYVRPAPPEAIRLMSGPEGSSYRVTAGRYQEIIQKFGVKVEILPSRGSLDNLQVLAGGTNRADVGFVQGGLTDGLDTSQLVSLGSVFAQPLMVYYRETNPGAAPIEYLSQLRGKRLAIGPPGSGTRALAIKLLKANEIDGAPTVLLDLGGEEAAKGLASGAIDAAFLMGDSAPPRLMRRLRETAGVQMINFRQAQGYLRRFRFLTRLTLPEGALDLGKNYPSRQYELIGPTVELVARKDLHPALSDLLITAAKQVHGPPGMFRNAGEFPAPLEKDFPISADAERYYKSGGHFLYKRLPFWLGSLIDRLLVLIVPLLVLLVPATRIAPTLYRWRVRSRIYRWYGALMAIEREMLARPTPEQRAEIFKKLDEIENSVNEIKTPLSFADQLYVLREHVGLVRRRLPGMNAPGAAAHESGAGQPKVIRQP